MSPPVLQKIACFDLDGTLTAARKQATPEMLSFLKNLRASGVQIALVSGSDLQKLTEQFGGKEALYSTCDYVFAENGVVAYRGQDLIGSESIAKFLGEESLKELINFVLAYFSTVDIPVKRGTFVEYRTGMLNFSPIGRSCSYEERLNFFEFDKTHKIRENFVKALDEKFGERLGLRFSIGGQISVDCFPKGWDKTHCLRYLPSAEEAEIHFFGDRTEPGGNDHELFEHPRSVGHAVESPEDTMKQCREIFGVL